MDLDTAEVGKPYRVVAKLEADSIGYELHGVLVSKRIGIGGVRHWHFSGPVWEHFVDPDFIVELEQERRRVF